MSRKNSKDKLERINEALYYCNGCRDVVEQWSKCSGRVFLCKPKGHRNTSRGRTAGIFDDMNAFYQAVKESDGASTGRSVGVSKGQGKRRRKSK